MSGRPQPGRDPVLIMVAPNGARRTVADHPALPVTSKAIVTTAAACVAAGAGAIHAHVRDAAGRHLLDTTAYRFLLVELAAHLPDLAVQVTTEAGGRYEPADQIALLDLLQPRFVSVAVRELLAGSEDAAGAALARAHRAGVRFQYILYDRDDVFWFADLAARGVLPDPEPRRILLVFGRYTANEDSSVEDFADRIATLQEIGLDRCTVWMACAFGQGETAVLEAAILAGGHVRVGFENSFLHADGRRAADNAERVAVIAELARRNGRPLAKGADAAAILGA